MTTLGPTARAHLDAGFDTSEQWDEIATGCPHGRRPRRRTDVRAGARVRRLRRRHRCRPRARDRFRDDHRAGVRIDRSRRRHDEPGRRARGGGRRRPSCTRRRSRRRAGRQSSSPIGARCDRRSTTGRCPARWAPHCRRCSRTSSASSPSPTPRPDFAHSRAARQSVGSSRRADGQGRAGCRFQTRSGPIAVKPAASAAYRPAPRS